MQLKSFREQNKRELSSMDKSKFKVINKQTNQNKLSERRKFKAVTLLIVLLCVCCLTAIVVSLHVGKCENHGSGVT